MTTPPRVTPDDAREALARIVRRHRAADDDATYIPDSDPREMLAYLRKRGACGLLFDEDSNDVEDALTLRVALWWEGEDVEDWLLAAVERRGLNRRRVGAVLGIRTGQGLVDRRKRTRARLATTAELADDPPAEMPTDPAAMLERWRTLRAFAALLLQHRGWLPDDVAEDLSDVLRAEMEPARADTPVDAAVEAQLRNWCRDDLASVPLPGDLGAARVYVAAMLGVVVDTPHASA